MNFISLAVSVFISNYIFMAIIRLLPIKRKKLWQAIIISLADISSILGYAWMFILSLEGGFDLTITLELLGSILGIIIGYVAAMMLVLDGISIFKSKRLKEFERGINKKDEKSIPKNIIAYICFFIALILVVYSIFSIINYNSSILTSLIGTIIGSLVAIGLGIFFYISGKPLHQELKSANLLLYIKLPDKELVYEKELSKELNEKQALNGFDDTYILDEFGMIVTPNKKYVVKGIMVTKINKNDLEKINMNLLTNHPFQNALNSFQKYNRKKITLNENNEITNIKVLK